MLVGFAFLNWRVVGADRSVFVAADSGFSDGLPELNWRCYSLLRAPAEPKPLQRVSEQVSRRRVGGEVVSATRQLQ